LLPGAHIVLLGVPVHCASARSGATPHRGARTQAAISQKVRVSARGFGLAGPGSQWTNATVPRLPENSRGEGEVPFEDLIVSGIVNLLRPLAYRDRSTNHGLHKT
jgi:hypothetical protein